MIISVNSKALLSTLRQLAKAQDKRTHIPVLACVHVSPKSNHVLNLTTTNLEHTLTPTLTRCGRCHACGTLLQAVLDGEEWCPICAQYRRYQSHGWAAGLDNDSPCPPPPKDTGKPSAVKTYPHHTKGYYYHDGTYYEIERATVHICRGNNYSYYALMYRDPQAERMVQIDGYKTRKLAEQAMQAHYDKCHA